MRSNRTISWRLVVVVIELCFAAMLALVFMEKNRFDPDRAEVASLWILSMMIAVPIAVYGASSHPVRYRAERFGMSAVIITGCATLAGYGLATNNVEMVALPLAVGIMQLGICVALFRSPAGKE